MLYWVKTKSKLKCDNCLKISGWFPEKVKFFCLLQANLSVNNNKIEQEIMLTNTKIFKDVIS